MNTKLSRLFSLLLVAGFLVTGCGPGQLFGPVLTMTPTPSQTPLPTATLTVAPTASVTPTTAASLTPTVAPTSDTSSPAGEADGLSLKTAIIIKADDEFTGIAMEYQWIEDHYPGYKGGGQSTMSEGDLIYDVISITTADGVNLKIYFDITSFYGKL